MVPSIVYSITMYYDNNGAIAQAKKSRFYQLSKNILRQFYLIKES
jgi:hypothetical protein